MPINRLAMSVAGSVALAASLTGVAVTAAPIANAAPKFSAIAYSATTGAWGYALRATSQDQATNVALTFCVEQGGPDCVPAAASGPGGCVALARNAQNTAFPGTGPSNAEAQGAALAAAGGGKILVSTCSGGDNEAGDPIGRGGISPYEVVAPPAAEEPPVQAPPPGEEPPVATPPAPVEGPSVAPNAGIAGVTFTVTDRSGVASVCTYSSEGFDKSFNLPANGTVDVFVPAIRLFTERTGTITCDNGTSSNTSVFY